MHTTGKRNAERHKKSLSLTIEGLARGVDELLHRAFLHRRGEFAARVRLDNGVDDGFKIVIKHLLHRIIAHVFLQWELKHGLHLRNGVLDEFDGFFDERNDGLHRRAGGFLQQVRSHQRLTDECLYIGVRKQAKMLTIHPVQLHLVEHRGRFVDAFDAKELLELCLLINFLLGAVVPTQE